MRILLTASSLEETTGGLPVCVANLAAALAKAGHDVTVAGQCGSLTGLLPAFRSGAFPVEAVIRPTSLVGQMAACRDLARFVRSWTRKSDDNGLPVVHTHGVWTPTIVAAAAAALSGGSRLVISPHGMLCREALRRSRFAKQIAWLACVRRQVTRASAVHVTSLHEAADLQRLLPDVTPVLIGWGVETRQHEPTRSPRVGDRVAAYLGRMLPIKGLDMLVDAWSDAKPEGWILRLAGPCDPGMAYFLRNRITARGMADRIRLEAPVAHAEIPRFLAGIDLFVLPSRSENFSLVVGEALVAGVPVITTSATAWEEVTDRGCGWCVPPDTKSLAGAIKAATHTSPAELLEMGNRGSSWVRRVFTWPDVAQRLINTAYLHNRLDRR